MEFRILIIYISALFLGNPQPKYKWFKDGVPLSNELTSEIYYRIQSTRREDAGVYHCVATNDVGSIFSERITFAVACTYKLHTMILRINEYKIFLRMKNSKFRIVFQISS